MTNTTFRSETAMGTRMAPSYANLFMGKLEHETQSLTPQLWIRFLDDILMLLWTHGETSLNTFVEQLNQFRFVQFTWFISNKRVILRRGYHFRKQPPQHVRSHKTYQPHAILTLLKFPPLPHQERNSFLSCTQRTTPKFHHLCY